ncbi:outer membrane beta-barrel protein [Croceimicrobium hydrocarbonivorans]|uniref:Outer membrane beta-barrel protein n=1 Tax=Croceimicrobium hydrocarbonivorans TaxID=2761580 RepID=A0A7H0VBL2_9FLAO|nr:outer membrane beta-barrel protein [Croceimicrobium hydrocarbonivorans]QNR23110.1 outer membrane beta-barrel protein [Croceimicrobium hydrocarbonivorans]
MKKTLILSFCFLCAIGLKAQIEKGNFLTGIGSQIVSGGAQTNSISFTTYTVRYSNPDQDLSDQDKLSSFHISPRIGYFIFDHFATGINFSYYYAKSEVPDWSTTKTNQYLVGPFVRYYYPFEKFWLFSEIDCAFGGTKTSFQVINYNEQEYNSTLFKYQFALGIAMPLHEKISLDLGFSYSSSTADEPDFLPLYDKVQTRGFGLNLGLSIFLGR